MPIKHRRPLKYGKHLDEIVKVGFTEDHLPVLAELAQRSGASDVSTWIREIVLGERPHPDAPPHPSMIGTDSVRAKFLTKAPCGPWEEAIEHAGHFTMNREVAEELEAREGDVVVRAVGESMDGAGIHDDALVLMRPLIDHRQPRVGEIALVQVILADGQSMGTIKEWRGGTPPVLRDGDGNDYAYPENVQEVRAVAVARGIIARLT